MHFCVCACVRAKAWKAASQTVISKTMCQLTEHMLHCTQDFLQARPSVYFSCNVRAARFTTATLNLHCGTSCLQQQPDAPRQHWPRQILHRFLLNLQNIPLLSSYVAIFRQTKGDANWFGAHVNSSAFMSQIPLRVTASIRRSSRGLQRERPLFKSALHAKSRE